MPRRHRGADAFQGHQQAVMVFMARTSARRGNRTRVAISTEAQRLATNLAR